MIKVEKQNNDYELDIFYKLMDIGFSDNVEYQREELNKIHEVVLP